MTKRQAKQTAHAIAAELILRARMDDIVEFSCDQAPDCGPCTRCKDNERVQAALLEIQRVHEGLGHNHFGHDES